MAKTIVFLNEESEEIKTEDRQIKETEDITQTVQRNYTLNQKQLAIDSMNANIAKLQAKVPILEAELEAIKTTLNVAK